MHNILGMEVWTRVVCSRDPEEVQDDGLQGHDHTYRQMIGSYNVPDEYETRYLLRYEHLDPVPDRSKTCSLACCKTYSEVPEGYN